MPLKTQKEFDMNGGITIKPPPKGPKEPQKERENPKGDKHGMQA